LSTLDNNKVYEGRTKSVRSDERLTGADLSDPEWVIINHLMVGRSPRINGPNEEHVRLLADSESPLPPIVVQRRTRRVVDGVHRLRAAMLRGEERIQVRYFDGDDDDAFVVAVHANRAHGLPLSLADREAAAARIIVSHSHYSDRAIAEIAGLSAKTIGSIRRTLPPEQQRTTRIGRDGRVRPVSSADGRRVAHEVMAENPNASLREVARRAGISVATVRDVRERLRRGDDPVPPSQRAGGRTARQEPPAGDLGLPDTAHLAFRDRAAVLRSLYNDPALRFNESGRSLLRWLHPHVAGLDEWPDRVRAMPPHCAYTLIELARSCADEWQRIALELEHHLHTATKNAA
jgi:ParB-like chromosome segregation protein Spo0J